jgi:hypothetical protein
VREPRHRRYIDDTGVAGCFQQRISALAQPKHRFQVGGQQMLVFSGTVVGGGLADVGAHIVDENMQRRAEPGHRHQHLLPALFRADVGGYGVGLVALGAPAGHLRLQLRGLAGHGQHCGPKLQQLSRYRRPNAFRRPRNKRQLASQAPAVG